MLSCARVEAFADYHGAARLFMTYDETPIIKQIQDQLDNLNPLKGKR